MSETFEELLRRYQAERDRAERLEGAIREALDYLGAYELEASVGILRAALATPTEAKAPYTVCPECLDAFGVACGACLERDGSDV